LGQTQREAAQHHKSYCLGPWLLICQAIYYNCGKMPFALKPLNGSHLNLASLEGCFFSLILVLLHCLVSEEKWKKKN